MWAAAWWGMWETRASRELPLLVWSFMVRLGGSSGKKGAFINVFRVIMFFGQDQPGSEGRRHAHPGIKLPPEGCEHTVPPVLNFVHAPTTKSRAVLW